MSSPLILSQQSINTIVVVGILIALTYYSVILFYWLTQKFKQGGTTKKVDSFLRIYIFMATLFTVLLWKIMKTNTGTLQREIVLAIFMITASLAIIAVLWRAQILKKLTTVPHTLKNPPGFFKKPYIYWPYFLVLGFASYVNINIILAYTGNVESIENRMILIRYFFLLIGFLVLCRVVSRCIDYIRISNCEKNDKYARKDYNH